MASRILAQILLAGGTMVARAAMQAYKQALVNGQKAGVNAESIKAAAKGKQMSVEEARKILGIDANAPWEDVVKRYEHLFRVNEQKGSFYLQSKVYRAKETLETEQGEGSETKEEPPDNNAKQSNQQ
ncbi:hypothetical protein BSKO_11900 [Bryopsis sp. KO-2023]|nr:hypothetical protein BSKO_11900 [Bryopsis sp. KO-2023]